MPPMIVDAATDTASDRAMAMDLGVDDVFGT